MTDFRHVRCIFGIPNEFVLLLYFAYFTWPQSAQINPLSILRLYLYYIDNIQAPPLFQNVSRLGIVLL